MITARDSQQAEEILIEFKCFTFSDVYFEFIQIELFNKWNMLLKEFINLLIWKNYLLFLLFIITFIYIINNSFFKLNLLRKWSKWSMQFIEIEF